MTELLLLTQRVESLERYVAENKGNTRTLEKSIGELNTTIRLLAHTVETLKEKTDASGANFTKAVWVAITSVITAGVTFMLSGGLRVLP